MSASHWNQRIATVLLFVVICCTACTMERSDAEVYEMLDQALLLALASPQVTMNGSSEVLLSNQSLTKATNTSHARSQSTDEAARTIMLDLEELHQVPKTVRMRSISANHVRFDIEIAADDLKPLIHEKLTIQLEQLKSQYSSVSENSTMQEVRQQALERAKSHMNEMMNSLNIHASYQLSVDEGTLRPQSLNMNTYMSYVSHGEPTEEVVRGSYTFEYGGEEQ